jgi:hypothetical protein
MATLLTRGASTLNTLLHNNKNSPTSTSITNNKPPHNTDRSPLLQSMRHASSGGSSDHQAELNEKGALLSYYETPRNTDEDITGSNFPHSEFKSSTTLPVPASNHVALQMQTPKGVEFMQIGHRLNTRLDFLARGLFRSTRVSNVRIDMDRLELVVKKHRWLRRSVKTRCISLFRIQDVLVGHSTANFQRWGKNYSKDLSFSIIYEWKGRRKLRKENFVLISPDNVSQRDRDEVVRMLRDLVRDTKNGTLRPMKRLGTRANSRAAFWENALQLHDHNRDGLLSVGELGSLLSFLGASNPNLTAQRLMEENDINKDGVLETSEFIRVLWEWKKEPQLTQVFADLCLVKPEAFAGPESYVTISRESLINFCCQIQGETPENATAWVDDILKRFGLGSQHSMMAAKVAVGDVVNNMEQPTTTTLAAANPTEQQNLTMDFAGFCDVITSSQHNSAISSRRFSSSDLTRPLSHYYISSSHNTYLRHDQLVGSSTVEAYLHAYRNGFRCVEVDLWDGSGGQPVITHGMTATEKMSFETFVDVTVSEGFATCDTPLIISLENHASPEQQKVAAQLMVSRFNELLFGKLLPRLMSPAELKRCILIKASYSQVTEPTLQSVVSLLIEPFLGDDRWDEMIARPAYSMLNIPETTLKKIKNKTKFAEFARSHLIRVYPFGLRIDSSNLDPLQCWGAGCQIAALNVQKSSLAIRINHAMFDPLVGWSLVPTLDPRNHPTSNNNNNNSSPTKAARGHTQNSSNISGKSITGGSGGGSSSPATIPEHVFKIRILSGRMLPKTKSSFLVELRVVMFDPALWGGADMTLTNALLLAVGGGSSTVSTGISNVIQTMASPITTISTNVTHVGSQMLSPGNLNNNIDGSIDGSNNSSPAMPVVNNNNGTSEILSPMVTTTTTPAGTTTTTSTHPVIATTNTASGGGGVGSTGLELNIASTDTIPNRDGPASAVIRENPDEEDNENEEEEERLRKVGLLFNTKEIVGGNSMDPQFESEEFIIRTRSPQTTLLIFCVKTNRKKLCVGGCALIDLKLGYRALPLLGRRLDALPNNPILLIKVEKSMGGG